MIISCMFVVLCGHVCGVGPNPVQSMGFVRLKCESDFVVASANPGDLFRTGQPLFVSPPLIWKPHPNLAKLRPSPMHDIRDDNGDNDDGGRGRHRRSHVHDDVYDDDDGGGGGGMDSEYGGPVGPSSRGSRGNGAAASGRGPVRRLASEAAMGNSGAAVLQREQQQHQQGKGKQFPSVSRR